MRTIPDFATSYLEVTAEGATDDFGREMFAKALHRVVEFRGLTEVAEKASGSLVTAVAITSRFVVLAASRLEQKRANCLWPGR